MNNLLLETLQSDTYGVLRACPALAAANIIKDDEGDIEAKVKVALASMSGGETNQCGLAIIVMLPEVTTADENLPGPPLHPRVELQVIEQVTMNRGGNGTGMRSSQAALEALNALQLMAFGLVVLYAEKDPIQPIPVKAGHVSHAVRLVARAGALSTTERVRPITPSLDNDEITLVTETPDAEVRYTTDGSYPSQDSGTLYDNPFSAPAVGTTIRAVATAEEANPSDLLIFTITE